MNPLGPLPYEWLGLLALAILWVNVLLVAGAALAQRRRLGEIRASWLAARSRGELVEGVVERGDGPEGALAIRRIEQSGRAMTVRGPDRILFTDRRAQSASLGGAVRSGDRVIEVAAQDGAEIWIDDAATVTREERDFDGAWSRASTNKGLSSWIEQRIVVGDSVFVDRGSQRIAAMDPIAFVDRKRSLLLGFAALDVVGCALVSTVALWPPALGVVSTIGGVLGIAYFLGITPLATQARDAARIPPHRPVGGIWQRPAS